MIDITYLFILEKKFDCVAYFMSVNYVMFQSTPYGQ